VEGDLVGPGAELAQLDDEDLKASQEERAAELQAAERRLQALQILEPIEIRRAEADLAERKAEREQAQRTLERLETLRTRELVSAEQLEIAATDRALAVARAERVAVNLEQVRASLRTEISTLGAQVEQAKAALRAVEVQLHRSTLRSPLTMPAQVYAVHQRQGEVTTGQPSAPVMTLLDLSQLQVHLFIDEGDFGGIQVGQPATLRVESYRDKILKGEIVRVLPEPILQENVVYYLAVVDVAADQRTLLRPEMTCLAFVQAGVKEAALWLPVAAVRSRADGWYVRRPGTSGPVEAAVQIGWRDQERVEIRQGLKEGDEVLLEP
jgi:multidrug resistance efflux pump